ncbi:MAG: tRNA modification GTPase [Fibrobacter sp.]|nr:tRNA modification GTPase [Fibrobacter sp.]
MDSQTIVAPMTPAGVSAVAAIRVSGSKVREVVCLLFGESALKNLKPREAKLATARDYRTMVGDDRKTAQVIDCLLYIFFEGPNSYTGEDVLELYPHGNPIIVRELIQVIKSVDGVRLAEPGEYTRRAFLNGRMDLVQAESVADVIHSANRDELKNAHRLLGGALSKKVKTLTEQVMDISARLELDVDFAEEEADPDYATWDMKIEAIRESVESILKSFKGKAAVSRLPLAVLYGAPNAGKSSLVNALLGEDRILVSNIPGTTRDFVEVRLFLDGGEIRLVDTAGIADKATDALDALSMEKSKEILAEADMKILVVDGSDDKCEERASQPCLHGNDRAQHLVLERSESTKTKDERGECCGDACVLIAEPTGLGTKCKDESCDRICAGMTNEENVIARNDSGACREQSVAEAIQPDFVVVSKSDLGASRPGGASRLPEQSEGSSESRLRISSKTGEGLAELKRAMNAALFKKIENSEDLWITSEREKTCLEEALAGIDRALSLIRTNPAVELLAFEMQLVRRSLQSITGEISSEDVLQKIFAGFCIGK